MRLVDYMAEQGIPDPRDQYAFLNIKTFVFGERYSVLLRSGVSIDFDDLQSCLEVIDSEFTAQPIYVPSITIESTDSVKRADFGANKRLPDRVLKLAGMDTGSLIGDAAHRVLAVTPAGMSNAFPRPPLQFYTDDIMQAVTIYNLTQSWDQYAKGNL